MTLGLVQLTLTLYLGFNLPSVNCSNTVNQACLQLKSSEFLFQCSEFVTQENLE